MIQQKKIKYSAGEALMLQILRRRKQPITTVDLADLYYRQRKGAVPYHARSSVVSVVKSLADKAKRNREPFTIHQSERRGPHPIEVQLKEDHEAT
jgi:hypothetical protein